MQAAESAIDLAMALEREACAEILDANAMACNSPIMRSLLQSNAQALGAYWEGADACAAAIRKRGQV